MPVDSAAKLGATIWFAASAVALGIETMSRPPALTVTGFGAISGPRDRARDRGASRLRRGATSVWGFGGHIGAPDQKVDQPSSCEANPRRKVFSVTTRDSTNCSR